jgi:hypothetical protein
MVRPNGSIMALAASVRSAGRPGLRPCRSSRSFCRRLQVGDQVAQPLLILNTAERHPIAWHDRLWVRQVGAKGILIPREPTGFHCLTVGKPLNASRLAAEQSVKAGTNLRRYRTGDVARSAGVKYRDPCCRIAVGPTGACRRERDRDGKQGEGHTTLQHATRRQAGGKYSCDLKVKCSVTSGADAILRMFAQVCL